MLAASIPVKMPVVWGSSAPGGNVLAVQIASGSATIGDYQRGWTTSNLTASIAGGTPPRGDLDNGLNNAITAWLQWMQAGGAIPQYDASFSSSGTYNIGGYPDGAMLAAANGDGIWQSTVDSNTSDPDTGGANWTKIAYLPAGWGYRNPPGFTTTTEPVNYSTGVAALLNVAYASGVVTVTNAGTYDVSASINITFTSAGAVTLYLYHNGTLVDHNGITGAVAATATQCVSVGQLVDCAASDTFQVNVGVSGGGFVYADFGYFKGHRVY